MGQLRLEQPQDLPPRFLFTKMSLSVFCHISIPCGRRIIFVRASGRLLKINSPVLLGHAVRSANTRIHCDCRSRLPCCLRRGSVAARLLGFACSNPAEGMDGRLLCSLCIV